MDKGTVYFIDDELPVLNALRRALRAPMKGWDVRFEQSPTQALEEMQQDLPWVIIVDRKMPEMDGSDFFKYCAAEISGCYPGSSNRRLLHIKRRLRCAILSFPAG